jgi:HEAT repeat protein
LVAAALAVGVIGWLVRLQGTDLQPAAGSAIAVAAPEEKAAAPTHDSTTAPAALPEQTAAPEPAPLTPSQVEKLLADAQSADNGARARALDGLSNAPEAEAVPVLQKALNGGEPIERQLALSSLHTLALRQGDPTGAIRELLRQAIYDGNDEAVSSGAQSALDDIEYSVESAPVDGAR